MAKLTINLEDFKEEDFEEQMQIRNVFITNKENSQNPGWDITFEGTTPNLVDFFDDIGITHVEAYIKGGEK